MILSGSKPNSQYPLLCFVTLLWVHIWACSNNQRWSVPCSCQLWGDDVVSISLFSLTCLNLNCINFAWSSNCYPSIYKVVIYQVRQDCVCGNVGVLEPTFGRRKESHVEIDIDLPWYVAEPHIVVVFCVKNLDLYLHARHVFTPKAKGLRAYPFIPCEVRVLDMNVSKCQQVNCQSVDRTFVLWIPNQGTQLD